jgi:hypothetical protein
MTNMTTTLEKSKELKLAGWNKPTKFYHANIFQRWEVITSDNNFMEYGCERIPAPTITELLEEMDNNVIRQYMYKVMNRLDSIDLFRSPDKLADAYLWGRKEGLIK